MAKICELPHRNLQGVEILEHIASFRDGGKYSAK